MIDPYADGLLAIHLYLRQVDWRQIILPNQFKCICLPYKPMAMISKNTMKLRQRSRERGLECVTRRMPLSKSLSYKSVNHANAIWLRVRLAS